MVMMQKLFSNEVISILCRSGKGFQFFIREVAFFVYCLNISGIRVIVVFDNFLKVQIELFFSEKVFILWDYLLKILYKLLKCIVFKIL